MKNKRGYTLVELLAVLVLLGVLAALIMPEIKNYIDKGKIEYNQSLEEQLLIAGKAYYSDHGNLLPKLTYNDRINPIGNIEKKSSVTEPELVTAKYLKSKLVDYDGNSCDQSYVLVTKNVNDETERWHPCLICGQGSKSVVHSEDPYCSLNVNWDDEEKPSCTIKISDTSEGDKESDTYKYDKLRLEFVELKDSSITENNKKGYSAIEFYNKTTNKYTYKYISNYEQNQIVNELDINGIIKEEGVYSVSVIDKGNNKSEPCISGIKIDNTDPVCEIEASISNTSEEMILKSKLIGAGEDLSKLTYSWKGPSIETDFSVSDSYSVDENGYYTSFIKDKAGNVGKCSTTITDVCTTPVNKPVLTGGMIPVYYDEAKDVWRKADSNNKSLNYRWYNYCNKKWANSVTVSEKNRKAYLDAELGTEIKMDDILTMQVWIPRYKYTVWNYNSSGKVPSNPREIQVVFENGAVNSGQITCTDNIKGTSNGTSTGTQPTSSETCTLKTNGVMCTDETCNGKTYTHPAFTFGNEKTGFWAGKFELAHNVNCTITSNEVVAGEGCNLTTVKPLVKPNMYSWRGAQVGTYDYVIRGMNDTNNIYGFSTSDDTHMIKNMEWGAIAYLTYSKYGICDNGLCREVALNSNNKYITGCGPQSENSYSGGSDCNEYETILGTKASTTGNIYGVYDIVGGSFEYVMGNVVYADGKNVVVGDTSKSNTGYSGIVYDYNADGIEDFTPFTGKFTYPESKYVDKYSFGTSGTQRGRSKLGDGIKEVYNVDTYCWNRDYCRVAKGPVAPWFRRGGHCNYSESAGVFTSSDFAGYANATESSRLVITK